MDVEVLAIYAHQECTLSTCSCYPGLLLNTELIVSLFIRCTMRCEIWAQPAELPW